MAHALVVDERTWLVRVACALTVAGAGPGDVGCIDGERVRHG
jgi:hypothetical protein